MSLDVWKYIKKYPWNSTYTIILVGFIVGLLLYGFVSPPDPRPYIFTADEENAKAYLENEIKSLQKIPGAVYQPTQSSYKQHSYWWERTYFTSKFNFSEVSSHYDGELQARGWRKNDGWNGRLWGNDNVVIYYKGPYMATIERFPDTPQKYLLNFEWYAGRVKK